MTSDDCVNIAKDLGFSIIIYKLFSKEFNARLIYHDYRYGEFLTKSDKTIVIHSHYWKPQDENISNIDNEQYKEKLLNFVQFVKSRLETKKLKKIEEDFV